MGKYFVEPLSRLRSTELAVRHAGRSSSKLLVQSSHSYLEWRVSRQAKVGCTSNFVEPENMIWLVDITSIKTGTHPSQDYAALKAG